MITITCAKSYVDIVHAERFFTKLATYLDFAVLFQDMQRELEEHPHAYASPEGCLHLAVTDVWVAGCSAVKRSNQHTCELKCLYVVPRFRGQGIGRTLASMAIAEAGNLGYKTMQLTTLPYMEEAIAIYHALGFQLIEQEQDSPTTKAIHMKLALTDNDQENAA